MLGSKINKTQNINMNSTGSAKNIMATATTVTKLAQMLS